MAHPITAVQAAKLQDTVGDSATVTLGFTDGSVATIHYITTGSPRFAKERVEVFVAGRVLQLDNFRRLHGYSWPGFTRMKLRRQDKGQRACAQAFLRAVKGEAPAAIPADELFEVARVTIRAAAQLR